MYSLETVINENIAVALGSSAENYRKRGDFAMSKKLYLEALRVRETLSCMDKGYFQPLVVETLKRLGKLSMEENNHDEAINYYQRAIEGLEEIYSLLPQRYGTQLIYLYTRLGNLYRKSLEYASAADAYEKSLSLYAQRTTKELQGEERRLLNLYLQLALVLDKQKDFERTKKAYMGALSIYGTLLEEGSNLYREEMASTLFDLGVLYFRNQRKNKAGEVFLLVLEMVLSLPQEGLAHYKILGKSFHYLGQIYTTQLEYIDGMVAYREALKYVIELAEEKPLVYGRWVAKIFIDMARSYKQQNKRDLAQHFQAKAITLYRELNHYHQFQYDFELAQTVITMVEEYGGHTLWLYHAQGVLRRDPQNTRATTLLDRIERIREERNLFL